MKSTYTVSRRDCKGNWHDIGNIEAASNAMARNIAYNRSSGLGLPGDCETHRVKPGKTIYEYSNGALGIEKIQ